MIDLVALCALASNGGSMDAPGAEEIAKLIMAGPWISGMADDDHESMQQLIATFKRINAASLDIIESGMILSLEQATPGRAMAIHVLYNLALLEKYVFQVPEDEMAPLSFDSSGTITLTHGIWRSSGPMPKPITQFRNDRRKYARRPRPDSGTGESAPCRANAVLHVFKSAEVCS